MKWVIIKKEQKEYATSYDDIKPDKYLCKLSYEYSPYSSRSYTDNPERAITWQSEEQAKAVVNIIQKDTPFIHVAVPIIFSFKKKGCD